MSETENREVERLIAGLERETKRVREREREKTRKGKNGR